MAEWDETVRSHAVWKTIESAQAALNATEAPADSEDLSALERLKTVVSHARSVLDNADPQLLSLNALTAMHSGLTQIVDQFSKLPAEGEAPEQEDAGPDFQNLARTVASEILDSCAAVAAAQAFKPEGIAESARSYRRSVNQLLEKTDTEVSEIREAIDATSTEIQAARESFESDVSKAQAVLQKQLDSLSQAKDEIATEVQEQKTRLDTMINQEAEAFGSRQTERQAVFTKFIEEKTAEVDQAASSLVEKAENQMANQEEKAKETLREMERHKTESGRLAQLIARASTAGGFQEYADHQKKLADWWAAATIVFLLAIAGGAIVFLRESEGILDARRIVYALSFAAAATYAAKQSAHHRKNERRSRQFELETAAIGPYIAGLDQSNQEAIQAYMAMQTFGHFDESELDTSWTPESLQKVLDILKAFSRKKAKVPPEKT